MIGSVRLKSKSCAFSIASAIDGGAKAAIRARDLAVADERDLGIWGSLANLGIWTRLGCWLEEREIRGLEEAIIELADCSRVFDGSSSTSATLLAAPKSTETYVSQEDDSGVENKSQGSEFQRRNRIYRSNVN
ncbi:hypothetical protein ISN45_Aa08g021190 [Arabidopsis thaliana x Arabidopsis arenosa]|uniref:Uncharacterized protein n=1 Tax=Arabidopsis thaliana x Arabidopsis arenosa TaxID=1240361 RepID=A0A8T1XTT9_9BRAS|nr:hypothetical protein ISN45_Aa08g021190 [Arabidopsis thaliana x Arabidopsis arenosa]